MSVVLPWSIWPRWPDCDALSYARGGAAAPRVAASVGAPAEISFSVIRAGAARRTLPLKDGEAGIWPRPRERRPAEYIAWSEERRLVSPCIRSAGAIRDPDCRPLRSRRAGVECGGHPGGRRRRPARPRATVPFIARYRKEATGELDEVAVMTIRDRLEQLAELDKRREAIVRSLAERELPPPSCRQPWARPPP